VSARLLTPDLLPADVRAFIGDYLRDAHAAGADLTRGCRWFFASQALCQLAAQAFGLTAAVLPAAHQRAIYGALPALIGVDPEVLAIASGEVALALYSAGQGLEEDGGAEEEDEDEAAV
jgi:hypothetical protein